ncbi:Sec-independent protein translocase TatC [Malonomonas rubra DSM 5091]|uniref:Sec-independent protein translocase protein TatC n=1 Tax=Malonomonas rubra DSM 5091 TaxID=1122189 RepID=A0A1M6IJM2_MALRU|nr:twin-arginine translocase subunit TatC [Malonomonas rubra]SHJ34626.1 Sec-independent protein translocase TatC [Malonomonas rubra DSM 5091]
MSDTNGAMPLGTHLEELRKRLMIASGAWLVAFLACYSYAELLFERISEPVRNALPEGSSLVFINATEPFFTLLKVAALAGLVVAFPIIVWQLWGFISPGLYAHEKKLVIPFVFFSSLCFGAGTYFGFTFVFPMVFAFLVKYGTEIGGISAMLSMGSYLTLASRLLIAFGLVFELPIVIFFLARMGVVDHKFLARNRKFALLLAFIMGAVLTPPDLFSQTSIALPFIILYEVGIIVARLFGKKKSVEEDEDTEEETTEAAE